MLADNESGKAWTESLYADWQSQLDSDNASAFEYLKLAGAVSDDLGDADKVGALVDVAVDKASSPFHFAFIADLLQKQGDSDRADSLYKQAADACSSATDNAQLVQHLRSVGASEELQKEVYAQGETISNARDKLQWAEGIVSLFDDKGWAGKAYEGLASNFSSANDNFIFANSKKRYLGQSHFW